MTPPPRPVRRTFLIRGRVQGVGFRWWTRRLARGLGLRGTVRNRADGTVEVRAAGTPAALAAFRDRLAEGPPGAWVESVETGPAPEGALPGDFEIVA